MPRIYILISSILFLTIFFFIPIQEKEPNIQPTVVTTFSILEDITKNIIGEHTNIAVKSIVPLHTDPHNYQPKPKDAKLLNRADLIIVNGWGFEGWLDKFIIASAFQGTLVTATNNLTSRKEYIQNIKTIDPHAWHSIPHTIGYVKTITKSLGKKYPKYAPIFQKNADRYIAQLEKLDAEITQLFAPIPEKKRYVVTTHDAFWYFGQHYKIIFLSPIGTDTDQEPSAKKIKTLINFIKQHKIRAIFVENLANTKQVATIAHETGTQISGTLYADGLSGGSDTASTYIEMMRHNARMIHKKLTDIAP